MHVFGCIHRAFKFYEIAVYEGLDIRYRVFVHMHEPNGEAAWLLLRVRNCHGRSLFPSDLICLCWGLPGSSPYGLNRRSAGKERF